MHKPNPKPRLSDLATPELSVELDGRLVSYCLVRGPRKTIGLSIDHRGLRVGAPNAAGLGDIEKAIRRHGKWVLDKLDAWRQRMEQVTVEVRDGLVLPFLDGQLTVRLGVSVRSGVNRAVWAADGGQLTLCLAAGTAPGRILEKALRERARNHFAERLAAFAPRLGVGLPPLALSSARTRWGSCSSRSGIRLNWRLLFFPWAVVDYVVVHELAHLKEMNHSPRFWAVVETLCPDWRSLRGELRRLSPTCPII